MGDTRQYPEGKGGLQGRYINNILVEFGVIKAFRQRVLTADVNTGLVITSCPALPGVRWRLVDLIMIAIGGAASGATDVRLNGIRSAATVALGVAAVAGLTQSTVLRLGTPFATAGTASIVALADGASFTQLDANTALTAAKTGGSLATSTAIDYILHYVADAA